MIVDNLKNIRKYAPIINNLEAALKAIEGWETAESDKVYFDGGFYMVQSGTTKPIDDEALYEVHRKYIDVQIMMKGSEDMAWEEIDNLTEAGPFDEAKDIGFLSGSAEHVLRIGAGMFYVVYPHDGHMPIRHIDSPHEYTKVVVKLPV